MSLSAAGEIALATLRRTRPGQVFLHRRGRQSGLLEERGVKRALPALLDERFRALPRHSASHPHTDMAYCRANDGPAARIFYRVEGDDLYVADILPHGDYEDQFLHGPLRIWKTEYAADQFTRRVFPSDIEISDTYGAALEGFVDFVDKDRIALQKRVTQLEGQVVRARDQLNYERRQAARHLQEVQLGLAALKRDNEQMAEALSARDLTEGEDAANDSAHLL